MTEQPEDNGSTWFRALQHVPRLRARVTAVTVLVPRAVPRRRPGRLGQIAYFGEHAARYARRTVALGPALAGHDAVLVQRGAYPMGGGLVARALERFPGRVVLDLDDTLAQRPPALAEKSLAARALYGTGQARALLARADAVVASTEALAATLTGRGADLVLPTVPDPAGYPAIRAAVPSGEPLRVGWIGSAANLRYLDPLRPVFARLAAEGVAELTVVSTRPWSGPAAFVPWSRAAEPALVAGADVSIAPLPDTPYTRAKSAIRALSAMAAHAPVIASPVGESGALVARAGAGVLAAEPAAWERALRTLAADPALRARLGADGRAFVERWADLDAQADALVALLSGRR